MEMIIVAAFRLPADALPAMTTKMRAFSAARPPGTRLHIEGWHFCVGASDSQCA
jgi:hypothetical protein